jgi:hypothetical protein
LLRRPSQDPQRQKDDASHQAQDAVDREAEEAEGQKKEPDEWIDEQGEQRQRPAEDEQYEPEEQGNHVARESLAPLAAFQGRQGADLGEVVQNGASRDHGPDAFARGMDRAFVDQLLQLFGRDAQGADGFLEAELNVCWHFERIITGLRRGSDWPAVARRRHGL